jgi:sugar O-acyltransferase (sialic acid O-acetyltransferase NeuD family)
MTPDRPILVVGAGGHAKVVVATLRACGLAIDFVVDDDPAKQGCEWLGLRVEAPASHLQGRSAVLAIGDNRLRAQFVRRCETTTWISAVHPQAFVDPSASIGPGSVVFAGAVVQPGARVGRHVIVNTGATIDHDCSVDDFVHVCPGVHLAGAVHVGEGALLGIGSVAKPGVSIGAWCTVGAGAAVVTDLGEHCTALGVPAKPADPKCG